MTPGARVAAAIEILDQVQDGMPVEQGLTRWARRSRFAGSKDRAAVRDLVFGVMRAKRSAAHFGRGETGRALLIGFLHQQDAPLEALFDGQGHAPAPLSAAERDFPAPEMHRGLAWNLPDWLIGPVEESLGEDAERTAMALTERAPVTLRVNTVKASLTEAMAVLADEGIETRQNPLAKTALTVLAGDRKIRNSKPYLSGFIELQDAASQAVVAALPRGGRVLDFCAGGGGKALAMAGDLERVIFAHDANPGRMADLPDRAARAGAQIQVLTSAELAGQCPFDTILCDAPCSGSGAWRRAPEGKWRLTPAQLADLHQTQDAILDAALPLLAPGGTLAYATCSFLRSENEDRREAFLQRHPAFQCTFERRFAVSAEGDGFYTAHFRGE